MQIFDLSLPEKREYKKAEIKAAFEKEIGEGFLTSFGVRMDAKCEDVAKLASCASAYQDLASVDIRDFNNVTHQITPTGYAQMVKELVIHGQTLREKKWNLTGIIANAEADALDAIRW